jgi:hypothetical protein
MEPANEKFAELNPGIAVRVIDIKWDDRENEPGDNRVA